MTERHGWVGRHDFGWNGKHYLTVSPDGTLVGEFYATEEDARAALAAAQAGAPDGLADVIAVSTKAAHANGFAAGIEAAAQAVERYNAKLIDDFDYCKNIDVPKAIRALRPPAPALPRDHWDYFNWPNIVSEANVRLSEARSHPTKWSADCKENTLEYWCAWAAHANAMSVCAEIPPLSTSEPAGAPGEGTRLVTIKLPDGYTSAIEFAKDCGFELIGERSFYVKRD